jgi:hypothetical protein
VCRGDSNKEKEEKKEKKKKNRHSIRFFWLWYMKDTKTSTHFFNMGNFWGSILVFSDSLCVIRDRLAEGRFSTISSAVAGKGAGANRVPEPRALT